MTQATLLFLLICYGQVQIQLAHENVLKYHAKLISFLYFEKKKKNGLAIHRLNHSATLSKQDTLDEDRTHDLGFIRPTL